MTFREKTKENIKNELSESIQRAVESGELNFDFRESPQIILEIPREKEYGDFSSPIAMNLARLAHKSPEKIAEIIVKHFDKDNVNVREIEVIKPGFINFRLPENWLSPVVTEILTEREAYGSSTKGKGQKVNLEFVSANPTGPMHIGNARGGAIGDVLANIFSFTGYDTTKEFYVNDAGNQIVNFSRSLDLRLREALGEEITFPEDLYKGKDVIDRAKEFITLKGYESLEDYLSQDEESRLSELTAYALEKNISQMKEDLSEYGINYDVWFSEQTLHDGKEVEDTLNQLIESGKTYEKDGAVWFKTSDYGTQKDDVLVRSNGLPTYFLVDIAYHVNKFAKRNFDYGINIWGADHYGHIKRLMSALEALGIKDKLTILTMQLVHIKKNDEVVRVSKRSGNTLSLVDLISQIGQDAARFFFNLRSPDSQFEIDLALAVEESNENPVFYVQYAHARISSILRKLAETDSSVEGSPGLLVKEEETALLELLSRFPEEVISAQENLDPSRLTRYAVNLAAAFHSFYAACKVNVDDEELRASRIQLIKATKQVLKNCSDLLGITAPEKM